MRLFLCLSLWLGLCHGANANDWRTLVQPIGSLMAVESADTVNARLGGTPPFDPGTQVTTIKTSTSLYFVRFYNPAASVNPSNPVGSWIMRSAMVRGLMPAQVRDLFALPSTPTMMTMVLVPAGTNLYTGIAAPIAGWGEGGGEQSKLIAPPYVPTENFFNQQSIGNCILCYRVLAPDGNANRVARYLDARIPAAYSDLESVYTQLDLLYLPSTGAGFRAALNQLSPERYGRLMTEAVRMDAKFNEAVDQRVNAWFSMFGAAASSKDASPAGQEGAWAQVMHNGMKSDVQDEYRAHLNGIVAGMDRRISSDVLMGLSAAFAEGRTDWQDGLGELKSAHIRLGLYGAWKPGDWRLQGGVNAGYSQSQSRRRMRFGTIDRVAQASPDSLDANVHLRVGHRLPFTGVDVIPYAGLDYIYQHRKGFSESGADSLNLQLLSASHRTLRSQAGAMVAWRAPLADGCILRPHMQLGWIHERPLGDLSISARMAGQTDSFTVETNNGASSAVIAGAGLDMAVGKNVDVFVRYRLEHWRDARDHAFSAGASYRF